MFVRPYNDINFPFKKKICSNRVYISLYLDLFGKEKIKPTVSFF